MRRLENFYDPAFQEAFRAYFVELGIQLKPDTGLWDEMAESAEKEGTTCFISEAQGRISGFILFQEDRMCSKTGFFTQRACFIRELWVRPEHRRQGLGTELVRGVEEWFGKGGPGRVLLNPDQEALSFYERLGYHMDSTLCSKNEMAVMVKDLTGKEVSL